MQPGLKDYLQAAIGPGTLKIKRVQLWDLYSRLPMYLTADLAGKNATLFNYKKGDAIEIVNAVAGSPDYRATLADTNIKSPFNNPYDMFVHGLAMEVQVLQHTSGTPGGDDDISAARQSCQAIMMDTFVALTLNDTEVDQLTVIDAPSAGGPVLSGGAMGTTAALATGASMSALTNGIPSADNFRNYLNEGPFFIVANSTIEMKVNFGNSLLTAEMVYKPANTLRPRVFLRAVLKGMRIWNI